MYEQCVLTATLILLVSQFPTAAQGQTFGNESHRKASGVGRSWVQTNLITAQADYPFGGDYFGMAVALSGNVAVVGSVLDDENAPNAGAAYVYQRASGSLVWKLDQKLMASHGYFLDRFGEALAVSADGSTILVGAWEYNFGRGAVFVFEHHGGPWQEVQKLTASDGGMNFGASLSISGDTLLVGAPAESSNGLGSAYVFERGLGGAEWSETQILYASDGLQGQEFGHSVALDGNTAVVGASNDDDLGWGSGSAYVYVRQAGEPAWVEAQKIVASDGDDLDRFGSAVAIDDDVIAVGAPVYLYIPNPDPGSTYVFEMNATGTWNQVANLQSSINAAGNEFGFSIGLFGSTLVVGDPADASLGPYSGSAQVFERDLGGSGAWGMAAYLTASDGIAEDWFGYSVAASAGTILCGALGADEFFADPGSPNTFGFIDDGAAYVFDLK